LIIHNLYSAVNVIRVTTSRTWRWTRRCTHGKDEKWKVVITLTWRQGIVWETIQNQENLGHLVEYVVCSSNRDGGLSSFEIKVLVLGLVMYKTGLFNAQW